MRFFRRSLIGLFLLALTAGLLAVGGNIVYSALETRWAEEPSQRPARERIFSVRVATIEPGNITPELTSFGEIRSRRTLDLRAPVGGAVVELAENFQEGGTVTKGELLAVIDPADAQAALQVAQTDLLEAEADLLDAERAILLAKDELDAARNQTDLQAKALDRQKDLLARNVGTSASVEAAELAVSSANQAVLSRRQTVQQAEARLAQVSTLITRRKIAVSDAERQLADTEIYAAFDGRLSDVSATAGGLVANNERLAQLVDPKALEVSFRVSTAQYSRLIDESGALVKAPVEVRLDVLGTDLTVAGRITRESAAVAEGSTGRLLFAEIDSTGGLRPGDFVTVISKEPALQRVVQLPATAVAPDGTVLVLADEDRLEEAQVTVLRRQGDDVILRARGLRGREVVTERSQVLGAGIKVKPLREDGAGVPEEPELVELDADRRARIIAFVEANKRIPAEVKTRMLGQLQEAKVPAQMVARIESRMGS
ncbi:HlyD family efflux transporter periplasmic adaptor subunit [uncultured Litoreibacter sp.]|uniref:efflux RND transporter periplasmic adaptor subunit n=1 Tax=uncultured Litoreibacter sp. TaxID=1392394 RepID=UPI0026327280|nr:HlyD family efflux transporter periplasmic adaptor subunit [uncultured Litoreibacter sp.]